MQMKRRGIHVPKDTPVLSRRTPPIFLVVNPEAGRGFGKAFAPLFDEEPDAEADLARASALAELRCHVMFVLTLRVGQHL